MGDSRKTQLQVQPVQLEQPGALQKLVDEQGAAAAGEIRPTFAWRLQEQQQRQRQQQRDFGALLEDENFDERVSPSAFVQRKLPHHRLCQQPARASSAVAAACWGMGMGSLGAQEKVDISLDLVRSAHTVEVQSASMQHHTDTEGRKVVHMEVDLHSEALASSADAEPVRTAADSTALLVPAVEIRRAVAAVVGDPGQAPTR
jgi:hypothetical protein